LILFKKEKKRITYFDSLPNAQDLIPDSAPPDHINALVAIIACEARDYTTESRDSQLSKQ
jgi:hypothetical protein